MGLIAIAAGIILGALLSQIITAMLLHTFSQTYQFYFQLYPDTLLLTVAFFVLTFAIVGLFNIRTICRIKVIDMLQAEHKTEHDLQNDKWIVLWIIAACIAAGLMFVTGSTIVEQSLFGTASLFDYFDVRYPLSVRIMFYGNIVSPVIFLAVAFLYLLLKATKKHLPVSVLAGILAGISVPIIYFSMSLPSIANKYFIPLGNDMTNTYLIFAGFFLVFAICSFFYFISDGIRILKDKYQKLHYNNDNIFLFGQIMAKLKTTSKTMAIICITLVVAIVLTILAPVFSEWIMGYLDARAPYDIQIFSRYNTVYEWNDLHSENCNAVNDIIQESETLIDDACISYSYFIKEEDFYHRVVYEFPVLALSLTDYNHLRSMAGLSEITLEEHEFTTQWYATASDNEIAEFLEQYPQVETDAGILIPAQTDTYRDNIGEYIYNDYTNVLFIFPDKICDTLAAANYFYMANTENTISFSAANDIQDRINQMAEVVQTKTGVQLEVRLGTIQTNEAISGAFLFRMIMMYTGIILFIICFTVLSLQQLSDATSFKYRFGVLRKLGVAENRINILIIRQMGVWFGLPIALAILTAACLCIYFINSYQAELFSYIGYSSLVSNIAIVVITVVVLLISYFLSTWILFRRNLSVDE